MFLLLQAWLSSVSMFGRPQGLGDIAHVLKVSKSLLDFHIRFLSEIFFSENIHVFILSLSLILYLVFLFQIFKKFKLLRSFEMFRKNISLLLISFHLINEPLRRDIWGPLRVSWLLILVLFGFFGGVGVCFFLVIKKSWCLEAVFTISIRSHFAVQIDVGRTQIVHWLLLFSL